MHTTSSTSTTSTSGVTLISLSTSSLSWNEIRFKLTLDPLPGQETYRRTADYIKQALAKIGIQVTLRSKDFATYVKRVYTDRDFDFTLNGMSNLFDPTVGVQRLYWSKNFQPGVPFSNGAHYSNLKVDQLLEAAAVETDVQKRFALCAGWAVTSNRLQSPANSQPANIANRNLQRRNFPQLRH